jgi:hypothetical protein
MWKAVDKSGGYTQGRNTEVDKSVVIHRPVNSYPQGDRGAVMCLDTPSFWHEGEKRIYWMNSRRHGRRRFVTGKDAADKCANALPRA